MSAKPDLTPAPEAPQRHEIYVPRYARAKTLYLVFGLVLFALSFEKLGPAIKLGFAGGRARGEAVRVVRTQSGGGPVVYTSDAEVLAAVKAGEEARDRDSVFWVEYAFATEEGRRVEARSPLGQHVKPLQPIRDRDGLPSTIRLWYDARNPERILLPLQFGTWFLPGMLALFGVLAVTMGGLLRFHANRPIEMPDLSRSHAETNGDPPA